MTQVGIGKLELDRVVPHFTLPSVEGGTVSIKDYRQKLNLVIAYLDLDRCGGCGDLLREFADNYAVYRDLETEILAVCPQPIADLQSRLSGMGLPFPVLSDERREVAGVYLEGQGNPAAAIFVTDRFGALQTVMMAPTEQDLPNQQSILDWLSLIESECPECGPGDESFHRE